jgi:hypothetical protein
VIAYEFYTFDENEAGEAHFVGILPERRKDPLRITRESIVSFGREVIGGNPDLNSLYFIQVEV